MSRCPSLRIAAIWCIATAAAIGISLSPALGPDDVQAEQDGHDAEQFMQRADAVRDRIDRHAATFCRFFGGGTPRWTVAHELECVTPVSVGGREAL